MCKILLSIVFICCAIVARAESVTIAALGDSLTQGYGLPQGEGFVPQLQHWLEDHGVEANIINAGVSGDTSAGGAARVDWTLTPDVDGLIVTLGGNDLLRGIDPAVTRENLESILIAANAARVEVLLIGMEAPGNFGAAYKKQFEANYAELAEQYGTLFIPSFMAGLAGAGADPANLGAYMQADGIHPNADGVSRIVNAVGPKVTELVSRISAE